jgi:signal transduction histidine kinase
LSSTTGPGFPPDFSEQAFERFTRADNARGRGGAGLGLSIVRAIAEAHGGTAGALDSPSGVRRLDLAPGGRRRRCRCFGPRLGEAV